LTFLQKTWERGKVRETKNDMEKIQGLIKKSWKIREMLGNLFGQGKVPFQQGV
jgi:hypothetical protein